jgi:sucrose phosphorylase
LQLRRQQAAFHPDAAQHIYELGERVFCFERISLDGKQRILVLANLTAEHFALDLGALPPGLSRREDLLGLNAPVFDRHGLQLEPYAIFWFSR